MTAGLVFHPLTLKRWQDIEQLFERDSVCRACWCMWWSLSASQWTKQRGRENKEALKAIVKSGKAPGILAYSNGVPIGWCSIAPREEFPRLERSRTLKRVDDNPVWSVVCFFVAKPYRKKGVSTMLLKAAIDYAKEHGAKIVEGYPNRYDKKQPDPFVFMGVASAFQKVGFTEVIARSKTRVIMRYTIK